MNNELAKLKELAQTRDLLIANGQLTADLLRQLADNEIDSDCFAVVSECESYGKETDAELSITDFAVRAACYVDALIERLEAAEAQVKELTADLDKESEIRHRIHEELNAIKGEQQSVKQLNIAGEHWMDVSPQKYRELSEERATVRTLYTHPAPAVLPKLVDSESICNVEGLGWIKNLDADECQCCAEVYNQAIADAKALGAKPLPTIVLTAGALKPDGRIWYTSETVEALIRAAGLEVKS